MILTNLNIDVSRANKQLPGKNWSKGDYESIRNNLKEIDWFRLLKDKDSIESWDVFLSVVNQEIDNFVPDKKLFTNNRPQWMNRELLRLIRKKRRAWKSFSESKNSDYYAKYKLLEKDVKKAIRKAKKVYEIFCSEPHDVG